jgi:Protein of unknown function (DUF3108)
LNEPMGHHTGRGKGQGADGVTAIGAPVKTLAALTLAVLLAHALVLQGTSLSLRASENKVTRPFSTRVIEIKAAAPAGTDASTATAAAPPIVRAPKPVPRRSVNARPEAAPPTASATAPATAQTLANESNQAFSDVPYTKFATNNEANENQNSAATVGPAPVPIPAASSAQGVAAVPTEPPPAAAPGQLAQPSTATSNAASPATTAYTVPGSVRLKYDVAGTQKNLNYTARAELLWLQDGNTYEARQEVSAFMLGKRVFTSTGRMTPDGLAPSRYSDKTRNELAAHFDRERQRVTFSANTPESPLQPGAQDRVSVFMQLASMLAGAPDKYPAGTPINVQIIGPRATEIWALAVDGEEKLNLPGGELTAIKVTRSARGEFDLKTEFWLAPTLGYLPARIRFTQVNGDFVDMAWRATEAP